MTGLDSPPLDLIKAREIIINSLTPSGIEVVPLAEACFRVLREKIVASHTAPPSNMSTMDGYAVSRNDTPTWQVIAEIPAGSHYNTTLNRGQALRVFTGSQLPSGVFSVIPQENVELEGSSLIAPSLPLENDCILASASDFIKGQTIFYPNCLLNPRDIGLIACLGIDKLQVSSRVRVSIVSSGSELVLPGTPIKSGQIYASNGFAIKTMVETLGGEARLLNPILDNKFDLTEALSKTFENSDLIVTIGGASVGDYDIVKPVLLDLDCQLQFVRVKTRPGRPIFFAIHKPSGTPILGLPGNPASCMVGSWIYLADMIKAMSRREVSPQLKTIKLLSASYIPQGNKFDTFLRARLEAKSESSYNDPSTRVSILPRQESGLTFPLSQADGLVLHRAFADEVKVSEYLDFLVPPHPML